MSTPRMGDFRKISIFLDFESPYLHDYWSDFKNFTHKTYLRVEIRRFSIVSVRKNKTAIYFCRVLCRSISDFGKSTTYTTLYIIYIMVGSQVVQISSNNGQKVGKRVDPPTIFRPEYAGPYFLALQDRNGLKFLIFGKIFEIG